MNATQAHIIPLAILLGGSLLCCAGCGDTPPADSPDMSWKPAAPALQPDRVGQDAPEAAGSAGMDGAAIDALVDEVSSPAGGASTASQDAASLIEAHLDAYGELLDGGDAALRHVVRSFLDGGQTGVRAEVMFTLMQELLGEEAALVEAEIANPASLAGSDAQTRFDAWFAAAGILLDRHGLDFTRENMPHIYAVVTAMQE